jgi:hypothetical protein
VVLADALHGVHAELDFLAGAHLDDQDVGVCGADFLARREHFELLAERFPHEVFGVDVVAGVESVWVCFALDGALQTAVLPFAFDVEFHGDGIIVAGRAGSLIVVGGLLVPFQPLEAIVRAAEGNQAQAMREHFVLDNGGVLVDEDVFDSESRDLGKENAAEGVGNRGVNAGERELGIVGLVRVEFDVEVLVRY